MQRSHRLDAPTDTSATGVLTHLLELTRVTRTHAPTSSLPLQNLKGIGQLDPGGLAYGHEGIMALVTDRGVRSLELDMHFDWDGGGGAANREQYQAASRRRSQACAAKPCLTRRHTSSSAIGC